MDKCKDCDTELETGYLLTHGQRWIKGKVSPIVKILNGGFISDSVEVIALRCPKCGVIVLKSQS